MPEQAVATKKTGRPRKTENTRLTKKQADFVSIVCDREGELTLWECAQKAGYSSTSSHTRAYELLNPRICPHVVAAVNARRKELAEKYSVSFGRHVRDLLKLRNAAVENNAWTAAIMAERLRGQAAGLYINRHEIRHGSIDSMSKKEVEAALAEIQKSMGESSGENEKVIEGEVLESGSATVEGNPERTEGNESGDPLH
jgi:phage terminase small subunit